MNKEIKRRVFWNQAGFSGLIIGGILSVTTLCAYIMRENPSVSGIVNNLLLLAAFVAVPYLLGRKFSTKNALWGLTFQRALAYMLVMYLLAGFIYGVSTFLIYNYDIEYYTSECQKVMSGMGLDNVNSENIEQMISSPLQMAFSFMFTLPFFAFLPAFIISALIRRNPAIKN